MRKINYKYQVGDIVTNVRSGKLEILEQTRIKYKNNKYTEKGYKYRCLICGNEDIICAYSLNKKVGCNVCSNQKIKIGVNDMWTTNPELAKLLLNPEDGYRFMQNANQYVNWRCPVCGNIIKHKIISSVNNRGLSCSKCNDKISYPEKFMYNILQQLLKNDFTYQLTNTIFKWIGGYRYDFYFKINNEEYIIETHGMGHYEKGFNSCGGKTVKEEKLNDVNKKELAINNNIKLKNYIVIDCRYSTLEWIKEHILDSRLNELFDLGKINWLKCHEYACSSLVKKICDLWNFNIYNIKEIANIMKLSSTTIRKYLKQGTKLEWCKYNPKKMKRKVICLNSNKIFDSIKNAKIYYNINSIINCCKNKRKYAGVDSVTGEYLQWQYYDEYLIKPKKLLSNKEIDNLININKSNCNKQRNKKIICLNNNKIFNSIIEAEIYYGVKSKSNIGSCCMNNRLYSNKNKIGEYLQWQYYKDYLIKPKKLLSNDEIDNLINIQRSEHIIKKIICLNNNKVFNSVKEASIYCNLKGGQHISSCCTHKRKYAGKDPVTKENLKWMYYEDYLILNNGNK